MFTPSDYMTMVASDLARNSMNFSSVLRGNFLDVVHHDHIDSQFPRLEAKAELILQGPQDHVGLILALARLAGAGSGGT